MSRKSKWNKIQSSFIVHHINYSNFFDFQQNNIPLESVLTASASGHFDYLYACINSLIVEDFVVEIHHGHFTSSFTRFFLNFCYTVVINILPGTLKNLKKTAFFSCVVIQEQSLQWQSNQERKNTYQQGSSKCITR